MTACHDSYMTTKTTDPLGIVTENPRKTCPVAKFGRPHVWTVGAFYVGDRLIESDDYYKCICGQIEHDGTFAADEVVPDRAAILSEARRVAVKAVMETGFSRGVGLTEMPQCHAKKCWCGGGEEQLNNLVNLVLTRAADEVARALILETSEVEARLDHLRDAWDEGYMHVMRQGSGRNTRGANPYIQEADRG